MLVASNARKLMNCVKVAAKKFTTDTWCELVKPAGMSNVYRVASAVYHWIILVTCEIRNCIANLTMIGNVSFIPNSHPKFLSSKIYESILSWNFSIFLIFAECFRWNVCDARIVCCQTIWWCGHKIMYFIWHVSCVAYAVSHCKRANNSFCVMVSSFVGTISKKICTCHSITVLTMNILLTTFVRVTVDAAQNGHAPF